MHNMYDNIKHGTLVEHRKLFVFDVQDCLNSAGRRQIQGSLDVFINIQIYSMSPPRDEKLMEN